MITFHFLEDPKFSEVAEGTSGVQNFPSSCLGTGQCQNFVDISHYHSAAFGHPDRD